VRIALLTRKNAPYGVALLELLADMGLKPVCIGVEAVAWSSRRRMANLLARRTGFLNSAWHNARIWSSVAYTKWFGKAPLGDYVRFSPACLTTSSINAPAMIAFLRLHRPDIILLGQSGVVRQGVLAAPRLGTLNAHPGILPAMRGVDVVKWSLYLGRPVASTLHWVDEGIDTGDIIRTETVPIRENDSIRAVEVRAVDTSLRLLAWGAGRLASGDPLPGRKQGREDGKQYYLMPPWTAHGLKRRWPTIRAALGSRAAPQGTDINSGRAFIRPGE
jgi:hypothetical protein